MKKILLTTTLLAAAGFSLAAAVAETENKSANKSADGAKAGEVPQRWW